MSQVGVEPAITYVIEHGGRSEPGLPGSVDDHRDSELSILDPMTRARVDPQGQAWNPIHPAAACDQRYLAGLVVMRAKGVRLPLVVRDWDGEIVDGHRRVATAIELGLADVPVVLLKAWQIWRAVGRGWRLEIPKEAPLSGRLPARFEDRGALAAALGR